MADYSNLFNLSNDPTAASSATMTNPYPVLSTPTVPLATTAPSTIVSGTSYQNHNPITQVASQYPSGGGSGSGTSLDPHINPTTGQWDDNYYASQQSAQGQLDSGYNSYFNSLNDMLNSGLPGQKSAQEQIAQSQFDQGVNSLNTQKNLGVQDLNTQRTQASTAQQKTLQDLTDNIKNLFQSGNVYLGARGAADSSAANQYSYALTQMGSKQRGDVTSQYAQIQNDINGRETRLNEVYNGQVKDLESQKNQQIAGIAQWYASAQNQIRQMQGEGQLQKSQQLLNIALQQLTSLQQEAANRRSLLDQWAANHATDINQLKSQLSSYSANPGYNLPGATPLPGITQNAPAANTNPLVWGAGISNDQTKTNLFGQPL